MPTFKPVDPVRTDPSVLVIGDNICAKARSPKPRVWVSYECFTELGELVITNEEKLRVRLIGDLNDIWPYPNPNPKPNAKPQPKPNATNVGKPKPLGFRHLNAVVDRSDAAYLVGGVGGW